MPPDANRLRVYEGKAQVIFGATTVTAGKGHQVDLVPTLLTTKFNTKTKDALYRWSANRAALLAQANITSARAVGNRPKGSPSVWAWNPGWGMYTFLPGYGRLTSPFGWSLYSPSSVWIVYAPRTPSYDGYNASNGGGAQSGYSGAPQASSVAAASSGTSSGVVMSGSSSASAPAAAEPSGARGR